MLEEIKADFCIEIDFDKNSENPNRIFQAMIDFIESFQKIDKALIESIDTRIEPALMLEDIEAGSLRTWLVTRLKEQEDEAIKKLDWKLLVGKYLYKAKYYILNFLEGKTKISSSKEIESLQNDLLKLAENTEVKEIPTYAPVTPKKLIEGIGSITKATENLSEKDKAKYITREEEVFFNMDFNFIPEEIEDLLTKEIIESKMQMILKVKKPDYLGTSQWEFRHDSSAIYAKILDEEWLSKFQNREIDVRPGDSIRATVEIKQKYGYDLSVVSTHYNIIKVIEVLPGDEGIQLSIIKDEEEK